MGDNKRKIGPELKDTGGLMRIEPESMRQCLAIVALDVLRALRGKHDDAVQAR